MKNQKSSVQSVDANSSTKTNEKCILKIDWCSHEAAVYAVMHWHYSKLMPKSKLAKFGVWEDGKFVGSVIYGLGATPNIVKPFDVEMHEICELVRVALTNHQTPVSRIIAITIKILKREMSGIRLIVSFADTSKGHHGGIYKAGGWIYLGANTYYAYKILGEDVHPRTISDRYGRGDIMWLRKNVDPLAYTYKNGVKYKYVMPMDEKMRIQISPLAKPYPLALSK